MEKNNQSRQIKQDDRIDIPMLIDATWKAFLHFWWIVLAIISLCASIMYFYAKRTYVPQYTAYSTFTVRSAANYGYNESRYNTMATTQLGSVFPYLLTNKVLRQLVSEDLGTNGIPGTIKASAVSDTNLITIQAYAKDPDTSYALLQSVLRNYPRLAKKILGNTTMQMVGDSGKPVEPANADNAKGFAIYCMAGCIAVCFSIIFLY